MGQLTKHETSILCAIAGGKEIQGYDSSNNRWHSVTPRFALSMLGDEGITRLRITPKTCSINGVVFAAPSDTDDGNYLLEIKCWSTPERLTTKVFESSMDRDIAYQAIISALNGVTK